MGPSVIIHRGGTTGVVVFILVADFTGHGLTDDHLLGRVGGARVGARGFGGFAAHLRDVLADVLEPAVLVAVDGAVELAGAAVGFIARAVGAGGAAQGAHRVGLRVAVVPAHPLGVVGAPAGVEGAHEGFERRDGGGDQAVLHLHVQADERDHTSKKRLAGVVGFCEEVNSHERGDDDTGTIVISMVFSK